MFSTNQQPTYSYYNFGTAGIHNQQFNEGEEARWSLEDPRFVSSTEEQLWRVDEPAQYQGIQDVGKFGVQGYSNQDETNQRSSFPHYTSTQHLHLYDLGVNFENRPAPPFEPSHYPERNDASNQLASHYSSAAYNYSSHPPSFQQELPLPSYPVDSPYPPLSSANSRSHPPMHGHPDPRLLHGDQHDPTLSARYQPSFENLPTASDFRPAHLGRPSSLNSLKYGSDRSQSSPPRGRQSPGSSNLTQKTPRRLNSNLSISIEQADSTTRLSNHSPDSSSGTSFSTSPYRSLPSPLSPVRKRPHSSHYENSQHHSALSGYTNNSTSSTTSYIPATNEHLNGSSFQQARSETLNFGGTSQLVDNYRLEQGVGELQLASRPSSSSASPATYLQTIPFPTPASDPLPLPPPRLSASFGDTRRVRESEIRDYIRATDKLQAGERTVLILNPRIAQRSYGTERRLLNPPPMAYLLGTSWHSHSTSSYPGHLPSPPSSRRVLSTPDVQVSIYPPRSAEKEALSSKESLPTAHWMAPDGKMIIEQEENDSVPISGRFISKSLAVSLEGDLNKDTISDVRTVVTVLDRETQQLVGTFLGKPITVISKPSKKKSILAGGVAGLNHGSLVALFNRAKAGSGSTRYLCTSGPQANFPTTDWKSMTSNAPRPFAPNDTSDVRFVSKTHSWDAFIVYVVDLSIPTSGEGYIQLPAPQQGYPKPPLNVVPVDTRNPQALYYNQPVVLQCLATGVVSPVLILRRIDSRTTVIGGGSIEPPPPNLVEISHLSVAPGERIGEPVSQYKNVAFEVYQASPAPRSDNPFDRRLPMSSFLGCINDEIGIHVAEEEKMIIKSDQPLTSPPLKVPSPSSQLRSPLYASTNSYAPSSSGFESISEGSSDDSESKKKRARTSTTMGFTPQALVPPSPVSNRTAPRHKRRGQSLSSLASLQKSRSPSPRQGSELVWTVPCGESGVWSILAIDLARHTFFVPHSVDSMPVASIYAPSSSQESYPIPSTPIGPALPSALRCEISRTDRSIDNGSNYAVLHGDNFDSSYTVWVGDQPCSEQTVQSSKSILFRPAAAPSAFNHPIPPRRISIVRFDGVVFPTNVYYRD
ncbi:hypothetical protein JCM3765_003430 [Sporobolomyces pararoseus]